MPTYLKKKSVLINLEALQQKHSKS